MKHKKFSITFVLFYIILSISIIGLTTIFVNQTIAFKLTNEKNQLVTITSQLTDLKTYLSNDSLYFSSYINSSNQQYYNQYIENKQKAKDLSDALYQQIKYDEKSKMHYRILTNLMEYEEELTKEFFSLQSKDSRSYQLGQDIKKLHSYLQQQCNSLTEAYIKYQVQKDIQIYNKYKKIQLFVYVTLGLVVMVNYVYIIRLFRSIVSNLATFSAASTSIANGEWFIDDIKEQRCLELAVFARAFNTMKNNIQQYITQLERKSQLEKELYEQKLKNIEMDQLLKESQLLSLQSQMNPHFLFNTLNIISRTAMFDGNETIVKLMDSMVKILRYNLTNIRNMVTLQEEVDIVKAYLYIQTTRFEDRMSFEICTEDVDLASICIPPMTIQPIVENCIKHGFKNKEKGAKITIYISYEKGNVEVMVEDNGGGMTEEGYGEKSQIGLENVRKRLELNFGKESLLQIESVYDQGTRVKIIIPTGVKKDDKSNDCGR